MRIIDWSSDVCSSDLLGRSAELESVLADDDIAAPEFTRTQAVAIERIFEAERQSGPRDGLDQQCGGFDIDLIAIEPDLAVARPIGRIDLQREAEARIIGIAEDREESTQGAGLGRRKTGRTDEGRVGEEGGGDGRV